MDTSNSALEERVARLERSLKRSRAVAACVSLSLAVVLSLGIAAREQAADQDVVRTRRLEVVDDRGMIRLLIGQDSKDTQRRSRAAGLTVFDTKGVERGGFGTMEDGSVVMAMDAPAGVGAPMPDRLGFVVWPDGSAYMGLIDNQAQAVVKLHSDGKGGGGLQLFDWDTTAKEVHTKTWTFDGEEVETTPMDR